MDHYLIKMIGFKKTALLPRLMLCLAITMQLPGVGRMVYSQSLEDQFKNPPNDSKVLTWWHWMNGNVTKKGISNDLEAMAQVGIGGVILFNIGMLPPGDVVFMGDKWLDHVAFAMKKADSLGLTFGIFNSDGWSMSGGPWITPENSMKQIVWKDTTVIGNANLTMQLPKPEVRSFYKEIATLAFPAISNEMPWDIENVSLQKGQVDQPGVLIDGNPQSRASFKRDSLGSATRLLIDLGKKRDLRRIEFDNIKVNNFFDTYASLSYSTDGRNFKRLEQTIPLNLKSEGIAKTTTLSFPKITARYLQINVHFSKGNDRHPMRLVQQKVDIGEIRCYASPVVHLWEAKSGQSKRGRHDRQLVNQRELNVSVKEQLPPGAYLPEKDIIDLSQKVDEEGNLAWKAPPGAWTILRIGYTSTLKRNGPASDAGRGLESDKMDAQASQIHFDHYVAKMNDLSLKSVGKPLDYMQMESWEAGTQNWTKGFETLFYERNGYSILPWLPVMAGGRVVNSYEGSNRFLQDLRNTIAGLISENYWAKMHELCKAQGIQVLGEGSGMQHYLYDPILYHQHTDVPMGESWTTEGTPRADCKNAASVAHTLGKKKVAVEAFTGGRAEAWELMPHDLKKIGDENFTLGVNQFVLSSYVHQPYEIGPGFTLTRFGNHFQRLNTWFMHAKGWFDYLTRCQFLLQQGQPVRDVCYFTGEGIPGYLGLRDELRPRLPSGYDYDGVNFDLVKQMRVEEGKLYLPSGASYHLLVFRDPVMTPGLIREIKRLVQEGATIVAPRPQKAKNDLDEIAYDASTTQVIHEIWGDVAGNTTRWNSLGKGKITWDTTLTMALDTLKVDPDFQYDPQGQVVKLNYIHRQHGETDIYFIANPAKNKVKVTARFRVPGKIPGVWDPGTGVCEEIEFTKDEKGITLPLTLEGHGSIFVVFKEPISSSKNKQRKSSRLIVLEKELKTGWNVSFEEADGAFKKVAFQELTDWTKYDDEAIRYFSGTATYETSFTLKGAKKRSIILDLGEVKSIAEVFVNDQKVRSLWKPPYQVDITGFVKKGQNKLSIKVTNAMINRLVGDERWPQDVVYHSTKDSPIKAYPPWLASPGERRSKRKTFTTYHFDVLKDHDLQPSGLLGPVKMVVYSIKKVNEEKL